MDWDKKIESLVTQRRLFQSNVDATTGGIKVTKEIQMELEAEEGSRHKAIADLRERLEHEKNCRLASDEKARIATERITELEAELEAEKNTSAKAAKSTKRRVPRRTTTVSTNGKSGKKGFSAATLK